jgi:hypothetical protein
MAKLISVLDDESLGSLTKTIRDGNPVNVSIDTKDGYVLKLGDKKVFSFDSQRYSNSEHNAVSVILAHVNDGISIHNKNYIPRKKVESLVAFKY